MKKLIIFLGLIIIGCGQSAPFVEGKYACTTGCLDKCIYETAILKQNDNALEAYSVFSECGGEIKDDNTFEMSCVDIFDNSAICEGTVLNGEMDMQCGTCQPAKFIKIRDLNEEDER